MWKVLATKIEKKQVWTSLMSTTIHEGDISVGKKPKKQTWNFEVDPGSES